MLPDIRFTRHVMEIRPTSDNPSGLLQVSGDPHDSAELWELALRIVERITHSLGSRRAGRTHSECPCPSNRRRVSCSFVCQTVQLPAIWCRAFPVAQDTRLARQSHPSSRQARQTRDGQDCTDLWSPWDLPRHRQICEHHRGQRVVTSIQFEVRCKTVAVITGSSIHTII